MKSHARFGWFFGVAALLCGSIGCATPPVNPSFDVSRADAKQDLKRILADPQPLDRPVLVFAGWADPFFVNTHWSKQIRKATGEGEVLGFSFIFKQDFDRCRNYVIEAVDEAWPSDDPTWTTEVDVIGFSMGGLVARYAAAPPITEDGTARRLRIRNLYTISSPHRGASMAWVPTFDRRVKDMRPGSEFLAHLDAALASSDYKLVPYTRLDDPIVGEQNTAPTGATPWWVHTPFLHRAHQEAYVDPRICADLLRRLRGETPYTTLPAAALPE